MTRLDKAANVAFLAKARITAAAKVAWREVAKQRLRAAAEYSDKFHQQHVGVRVE